jgi:hypothetical protein
MSTVRSYTPQVMRDDYVPEETRQAQRRLAPHLKPIDALLMKWAPEARHDGAPRWPVETMLSRIIDQTALGASQSGSGASLAAPADVEFADWAVSSLMPDQREVIFAEYVKYSGLSVARKCSKLGMTEGYWTATLKEARGGVYLLCKTYGRMLHLEIV